jgi:hypothetical protein
MYTATTRSILRRYTTLEGIVVTLERIDKVDNHRDGQILQLYIVGLNLGAPILGVNGLVEDVNIAIADISPGIVVVEYNVKTFAL